MLWKPGIIIGHIEAWRFCRFLLDEDLGMATGLRSTTSNLKCHNVSISDFEPVNNEPVSYTHLTLPTKLEV